MSTHIIAFALVVSVIQIAASGTPPPPAPGAAAVQDEQTKIKAILADPALWGKDFDSLLSTLKDWRESGESKIEVFAGEAVGATPPPNAVSARGQATQLHSRMIEDDPKFKPEFEGQLNKVASVEIDKVVPTVHPSKDDQMPRVVMLNKSERTEYLAPGLTIDTVQARLGQPESVSEEVKDTGDERRPIVLKRYHYAGGAIIFAESDVTKPGKVERVILDATRISGAIF